MNAEIQSIEDLLQTIILSEQRVFIVGHNAPDLDSIASAIGLQTLCESLGKEAYIIVDEPEESIESITKKVRDLNISKHNIIDKDGYEILADESSTLIVTDTNKAYLVSIATKLSDFKNIIVIDHHHTDEKTIQNAHCYITTKVSSASEIVAQLLKIANVKCPSEVYTYLYGGIYLDTKRFDKNVGSKTHNTANDLLDSGADRFAVKELFLANFSEDKIIYDLIFNGAVLKAYDFSIVDNYTVAFTMNRENPDKQYKKVTIAKAADRLMKYPIEAAIVMAYIDEGVVSVSARSKGRMDVGKIMSYIGGGGNSQNAGAKVEGIPIDELEQILTIVIEQNNHISGEVTYSKDSAVIIAPNQKIKQKFQEK